MTNPIHPFSSTAPRENPDPEAPIKGENRDRDQSPKEHSPTEHSQTDHKHVHSEASLKQIINRLSRIEGHIRGVKAMVAESRPCPEVLVQIAAVRGAIDRVSRLILDEHLTECVARAAREGNIEAEMAQLKSALDRFLP